MNKHDKSVKTNNQWWQPVYLGRSKDREQDILDIISAFGERAQIVKAVEELGELSTELARDLLTADRREQIVEELTDVCVMLEQLMVIYNIDRNEVREMRDYKLTRTKAVVEANE